MSLNNLACKGSLSQRTLPQEWTPWATSPHPGGGAPAEPLHLNTCLDAQGLRRGAHATHLVLLLPGLLLPVLRLPLFFASSPPSPCFQDSISTPSP